MNEPPTSRPSKRLIGVISVAAAVVAALTVGAVALRSDNGGESVATTPTTAPPSGDAPISPGGAVGSCVERYDLLTLTHREVAFDGTVLKVGGDEATFRVNEWYRGGEGGEVTIGGAEVVGGMSSAGPTASLEPGNRLLVAGDGGFAWSCGFTQTYQAATADEWRRVLAG